LEGCLLPPPTLFQNNAHHAAPLTLQNAQTQQSAVAAAGKQADAQGEEEEDAQLAEAFLKVCAAEYTQRALAVCSHAIPKPLPTRSTRNQNLDNTTNHDGDRSPQSKQELQGQKDELLSKVGSLKQDLAGWRQRLEAGVRAHKAEVCGVRSAWAVFECMQCMQLVCGA
jgi:hypothetical protein